MKRKIIVWSLLIGVIAVIIISINYIMLKRREPMQQTDYAEYEASTETEPRNDYDSLSHDDSDVWKDEYESDVFVEDDGIDCYYSNMEVVFPYIPIGVVQTLRQETHDFLQQNGYRDATMITIHENMIIGNRDKVTFSCSIAEYPDKTLNVSFNTKTRIIEFTIR